MAPAVRNVSQRGFVRRPARRGGDPGGGGPVVKTAWHWRTGSEEERCRGAAPPHCRHFQDVQPVRIQEPGRLPGSQWLRQRHGHSPAIQGNWAWKNAKPGKFHSNVREQKTSQVHAGYVEEKRACGPGKQAVGGPLPGRRRSHARPVAGAERAAKRGRILHVRRLLYR